MGDDRNDIELRALLSAIQHYEALTGLKMNRVWHNDDSILIDWAYTDGQWAGTSCYDKPLNLGLAKLQRQIEHESERINAGFSRLEHFDPESVIYQLAQ